MSGRLVRMSLLGAVIVGVLAGPVLADEGTSDKPDGQMARLEALLEAQQKKIEALEQQVSQAAQADMNAARVEEMKKQIREVLSEQQFRESLMPSTVQAGYDKGFFIKSSDDKFMLKFNAQMQFRWTHYSTRSDNRYLLPGFRRHDRDGFDWARMRIRFSGHAVTKDLTYLIEFDSSTVQANSLDTRLLYAWVNYRFADEFQIKLGTFRPASTRADFGSTTHMQFVDYPTMNAVFGGGVSTGVRFWGQAFEKRVEYFLDIVNSWGSPATQTITTDENLYAAGHDNNPALFARVVWHALTGASETPVDTDGHFVSFSDIEHHTEPALDFGFHYAFAEDYHDGTLRIPFARQTFFRDGGFGLTSSEGLQFNQFGFDAAFKWRGFSLTGEYVIRIQDVRAGSQPPFAPLFLLTGDGSTGAQQGAYLQAGYFLPIPGLEKKLELVTRVGGVSALAGGQEGTWDYGAGVNYYIDGHRVKLQTDVTKVSEVPISSGQYSLANVNDDALIFRVQLQVAF